MRIFVIALLLSSSLTSSLSITIDDHTTGRGSKLAYRESPNFIYENSHGFQRLELND